MIDYNTYDPANDAVERESHLCESLSSEIVYLRQKAVLVNATEMDIPFDAETLDKIADYMERAQLTISYLQGLVMGQQIAMDNLKIMCKALATKLDKDALDDVLNGFKATPMDIPPEGEEQNEPEVSNAEEAEGDHAPRIYYTGGSVEDRIQ